MSYDVTVHDNHLQTVFTIPTFDHCPGLGMAPFSTLHHDAETKVLGCVFEFDCLLLGNVVNETCGNLKKTNKPLLFRWHHLAHSQSPHRH